MYDFGGFDDELYTLRYDAPGAPALATQVAALLRAAGIGVHRVEQGGLDHGIWTPLRFMWPDADVPVLPLAFVPDWSPRQLFDLGAALAPLAAQGVLVMGSGSITHNLRRVFAGGLRANADAPEIAESAAFRQWMQQRSQAGDWDALFDYRKAAPHALDMHPTDEHLLPWYVAAGAGGREAAPLRLHDSLTYGSLGMDLLCLRASGRQAVCRAGSARGQRLIRPCRRRDAVPRRPAACASPPGRPRCPGRAAPPGLRHRPRWPDSGRRGGARLHRR